MTDVLACSLVAFPTFKSLALKLLGGLFLVEVAFDSLFHEPMLRALLEPAQRLEARASPVVELDPVVVALGRAISKRLHLLQPR